jgi:hypothetical protein
MSGAKIWRGIVLYGTFFILLIAGWHELPGRETMLTWYVIVASAAIPIWISQAWK